MARSEDSWRTAQAWHRCRPDYRSQVYGEEQETTSVARMENVSLANPLWGVTDGGVLQTDLVRGLSQFLADCITNTSALSLRQGQR